MRETEQAMIRLAEECLAAGKNERPEKRWLKERYERFRKLQGGISKAEADVKIYRRMYGVPAEKPSDSTKIRFWRTGRHLPSNREQCESFGRALELSEEELRWLLQSYFDRCDLCFETESADPVYLRRRALMEELTQEYLDKIHPAIRFRFYREGANMEHSLRHIYYTDAQRYLRSETSGDARVERHIVSVNYESEFSRQMKLLGEIPRRTMIRHLLIFTVPYISRRLLSGHLEAFGYLPLSAEHTQADGSCLDRLLLGFLEYYEKECAGQDPGTCSRWFRRAYESLDRYLKREEASSLRFLWFKALKDPGFAARNCENRV